MASRLISSRMKFAALSWFTLNDGSLRYMPSPPIEKFYFSARACGMDLRMPELWLESAVLAKISPG